MAALSGAQGHRPDLRPTSTASVAGMAADLGGRVERE